MKSTVRQGNSDSMPDEIWHAIVSNDASNDGEFFYAVKTTGIFCRPSCKSKTPNQENVRIFKDAEQALSENFRPCKRCKPCAARLPADDWVDQIVRYIEKNYTEPLTLDLLAEMCHGSPYHLHRTFKRVKGMTPSAYIRQTRMAKAIQLISGEEKTFPEIALAVGIPNAAHFVTLFKKTTGFTPAEFRKREHVPQGGAEQWS